MGNGENLMTFTDVEYAEQIHELISENIRLKKLAHNLQQEIKDIVEQHPMEDK
jgi:meiotically up-regulated gene 157 (Mug157) protein